MDAFEIAGRFDFTVEVDYEDDRTEITIVPANTASEAFETVRRDPEVVAVRILSSHRV